MATNPNPAPDNIAWPVKMASSHPPLGPPAVTPTTRALASEARRLIQRHGWVQGAFVGGPEDGYCLVGACLAARKRLMPGAAYAATTRVLLKELRAVLEPPDGALTAWNDGPERTVADVLGLLDRIVNTSPEREGAIS